MFISFTPSAADLHIKTLPHVSDGGSPHRHSNGGPHGNGTHASQSSRPHTPNSKHDKGSTRHQLLAPLVSVPLSRPISPEDQRIGGHIPRSHHPHHTDVDDAPHLTSSQAVTFQDGEHGGGDRESHVVRPLEYPWSQPELSAQDMARYKHYIDKGA